MLSLVPGVPSASATAGITTPDCATLGAWASAIDVKDTYNVAPKLTLPKALKDERLLPVFGVTALDWTREDVGAAGHAIKTCGAAAKKAGDGAALQALKTAGWLLGKALPQTQAAVGKAADDAEKQAKALDALPDSAELARGIEALLAIDPAAPDAKAMAGLPRPIADPMWRLIKDLAWMPNERRAALFALLTERRTAVLNDLVDAVEAAVTAAPANADGVLAIMDARQKLASAGPSDQVAAVAPAAERRVTEIRTALRAAVPSQWVPSDCLDLYRWSAAEGASQTVRLGAQNTQAAFLDSAVVPVFGVSVADWSEADLARFKMLRAQCQAAWTALLPAGTRLDAVGDDAPELLRLAKTGYWIDRADDQVSNAKAVAAAHRATMAALDAATQQIATLPESVDSLGALAGFQQIPELNQASSEQRAGFEQTISAKRAAIMAKSLADAQAGLAGIEIAALGDLPKLYQYANATIIKLPDAGTQARFIESVNHAAGQAAQKLQPDFQAALDKIPASLAGLIEAWHATDALTGVTDAKGAPPFAGFQNAAVARARAIADAVRAKNCADHLDELDIDGDDAEQLLFDGGQGIPFGRFVCNLATGGSPVSDYSRGSTKEIKVMMPMGGLQTISLHEGEVAPGRDMLVGYRIDDANQTRDVSVQEWALFVAFWVGGGGRIVTDQMCAPVAGKPEGDLSITERTLALDCTIETLQNER